MWAYRVGLGPLTGRSSVAESGPVFADEEADAEPSICGTDRNGLDRVEYCLHRI